MKKKYTEKKRSLTTSLLAGACAGFVLDVGLFPLDTLKTRLQSQYGFLKSGGFRGIYKGVAPTAIGSAPTAALFFVTYNQCKYFTEGLVPKGHETVAHILSASIGEWASCLTRVPTEIIKQRQQACITEGGSWKIVLNTYKSEGFRGFFTGFWTTVLRDIPFAIIQFPLWEYFKYKFVIYTGEELTPFEGASCGALAGGISAALTTPIDVVKTQIMLSMGCPGDNFRRSSLWKVSKNIYRKKGIRGFFAGFIPRVTMIFLGGFVFFGAYEKACSIIDQDKIKKKRHVFWW